MFVQTNDGLVAVRAIVRIGPPENWPHGQFHKIAYQHGPTAFETYAAADDVRQIIGGRS